MGIPEKPQPHLFQNLRNAILHPLINSVFPFHVSLPPLSLSLSFYSAAVATNVVHTPSDVQKFTNTYLGKTGAGVELLVTVWMLLVVLVVELFCIGEESWVRGTFPIRYQIPILFSSLRRNTELKSFHQSINYLFRMN